MVRIIRTKTSVSEKQKGSIMSTQTINFEFNTAFSPTSSSDGSWDKEIHSNLAKALRKEVMLTDGIVGMNVDRHSMGVNYLSEIVDEQAVVESVQKSLAWMVSEGNFRQLFPIRGEKVPTATPVKKELRKDRACAVFTLSSDLVAASTIPEVWKKAEAELKSWILNRDGARSCDVYLRQIRFEYDPRVISARVCDNHVREVLGHLRDHGKAKFFPFSEAVDYLFLVEDIVDYPMYA